MEKDLAAAPKQQGGEELPEPVAWRYHLEGAWTLSADKHDEWNRSLVPSFEKQGLFTADQLRTAIAAERERARIELQSAQAAEFGAQSAAGHLGALVDELRAELSTLRQQLAEAGRDAKRYRWLRRIDSFAEWNRVGHYAADALDAAIDAAIAAQGEAKPAGIERALFEGE